jgi:hypothetical protein
MKQSSNASVVKPVEQLAKVVTSNNNHQEIPSEQA